MSAAHALDDESLDLDLEAAGFAFFEGAVERIAGLPFRFDGAGIRLPFGRAVALYLANPAAATIDGLPRSEIIVEKLRAEGTDLAPNEIGEMLSWPLAANEARGLRAVALVRRRELLRRNAELAQAQGRDPEDRGHLDEQRQTLEELDRIRRFLDDPSGIRSSIEASLPAIAIKTGAELRALTDREPLPPVYPGIPPRGHFTLRIGASFAGKTTAEVYNAMARAAGVAPWEGAPKLDPGRTLILAPDEPTEQIARQIRRLAWNHPGGRVFDYFDQIAVVGLDASVPMDALSGLRFHEAGFRLIDDLLTRGAFDALLVDAFADLLPPGESEQENETASRIGGALEALAVKHSIPITLIHHVGKTGGRSTAEIDVRDLGRGASALAAKARCIHTFEEVEGFPNQRRIRTRTNLTRSPAPLDLLVSDRGTGGSSIDYFRPVDPASTYPIGDVIPDGSDEWISTSELARRLSGQEAGKPGGQAIDLARTVRRIWLGAGLIETRKGARNATECHRIR